MRTKLVTGLSFLLFFIFGLNFQSNAQTFKFQHYGVKESICYPFVYSVTQDKNGFIWASTGQGLCRFDGFRFQATSNDSMPETYAGANFNDKNKNLWFGFSGGTIAVYKNQNFKIFPPEKDKTSSINSICSDASGNILAASQSNGIVKFNVDLTKNIIDKPFQGKLIYTIQITDDSKLLVGTDDGVSIYSYSTDPQKIKETGKIDSLPLTKVNKLIHSKIYNGYWVCTEDAGFYLVTNSPEFKVKNIGKIVGLEFDNIQDIYEDRSGNTWVSTLGKGVFKIKFDKDFNVINSVSYSTADGLSSNDIKGAYEDYEGNFWISTYGNGIDFLPNETFVYFDYSAYFKNKNVQSVTAGKDGYWVGGNNGVVNVTYGLNQKIDFYGVSRGLPADNVTSLYISSNGTIFAGTDESGIFQLKSGSKSFSQFFRADNSLGNSINQITGKGSNIYVSTKDGVYFFDLKTGKSGHQTTYEGLPHNNIQSMCIDSAGNAWVATQSNMIFALNNDRRYNIKGFQELEFTNIVQVKQGEFWVGTNGSGIFNFQHDTTYYFTTKEGLKSDYCYAMIADKSRNIWVGHRLGLSRINNQTHQIKVYGSDYIPGDVNLNAVSETNEGDLLFGTTEGLILYQAPKNKLDSIPPQLNITSLVIDDKEYDPSQRIVLPYGKHRMIIEFVGLNYKNPEQVTYQYKLEGFDLEWSSVGNIRIARYQRLTDGEYTFMVKACNSDGACSTAPLIFELKIRKPFWKTWWFISLAIVIFISSVYIIIKFRERKQKAFQIYLEKLLDERTKEVREQKEEIELKNRDITDSINYAQRIQASILPSLRKLQHIFTGSFVYYQPRDIVSGDFYWFDVIPNTNKFLVVCADSTGHGVPGAFMSLIGTTLLKDIFNRPDVQKPSDILRILDNELKSTLNQNIDGERPNDGMDIIVCEIDIKNYKACFSSAMRPFIVYQNGEQLYFKGSRSSIGGQVKEEKLFEDVEVQLTKGDLIYMFSDGYPDQFGGPLGKKFKMVRLRNLLKDIYQKPMEEQYNYVKSNFDLWRGELEQVDDVLFMGIKI